MMYIHTAFSKKNHSTHSTPPTPLHPLHSTELFKIFFSLLTLSTAFLQKACGPGNNKSKVIKCKYNNCKKNIKSDNKYCQNHKYKCSDNECDIRIMKNNFYCEFHK